MSGPAEPSAGRAVNANHSPSGEKAAAVADDLDAAGDGERRDRRLGDGGRTVRVGARLDGRGRWRLGRRLARRRSARRSRRPSATVARRRRSRRARRWPSAIGRGDGRRRRRRPSVASGPAGRRRRPGAGAVVVADDDRPARHRRLDDRLRRPRRARRRSPAAVVQRGAARLVALGADLVDVGDVVGVGAVRADIEPADLAGVDRDRRRAGHGRDPGRPGSRAASGRRDRSAGRRCRPGRRARRRTGPTTRRRPRRPRSRRWRRTGDAPDGALSRAPAPAAAGGFLLDAGRGARPQVARRLGLIVAQGAERQAVGLVRPRRSRGSGQPARCSSSQAASASSERRVEALGGAGPGALVRRGPVVGAAADAAEAAHRLRPHGAAGPARRRRRPRRPHRRRVRRRGPGAGSRGLGSGALGRRRG